MATTTNSADLLPLVFATSAYQARGLGSGSARFWMVNFTEEGEQSWESVRIDADQLPSQTDLIEGVTTMTRRRVYVCFDPATVPVR